MITGGPITGCAPPARPWFGDGAILSNGVVKLSGGAFTYSDPAGSKAADVLLNGSYSDTTSLVDGSISCITSSA